MQNGVYPWVNRVLQMRLISCLVLGAAMLSMCSNIVPAEAIYEPDWQSGKAVPARIASADGQTMGIAGLWTQTVNSDGVIGYSFTMLPINVDGHAVVQNFHRPVDEKRMVVMLQPHQFDDWLSTSAKDSMAFM